MRFNSRGQVADRRREWFTDTHRIFQDCSTGRCVIVLDNGEVLAERGANVIAAGGGSWAAWLGHPEGVFDWAGRSFPEAGLQHGAGSPDGAYAFKVRHHSYGPWDVIERDGSRWRLTDGDAADIQLLGNRQGIWTEGGWLKTTPGLPLAIPAEKVWWPRTCRVGDRFVLLYQRQEDSSLVLDGRVIAPPGYYFYPDVWHDGTAYHVVWSPNQADTDPQTMRIADLSVYPLVGQVELPQPPDPPKPEEPKEPPVSSITPDPALVAYFHRRWNELQVQARTDAADGEHAYREIQSGAFAQITAEWFYLVRPSAYEVGFYPKSGGTVYVLPTGQKINENILLVRTGGAVYWKDIIIGCGGPNPRLSFGEFERGEDAFVIPPRELLKDQPPAEPPDPPVEPPVEPPPSGDLVARVAALEAKFSKIAAALR